MNRGCLGFEPMPTTSIILDHIRTLGYIVKTFRINGTVAVEIELEDAEG